MSRILTPFFIGSPDAAADTNVEATTQALVITTYNATVTLGKVVEATTQALTITEHSPAQPFTVKSQALTITPHSPAQPFTVKSQALTITTYPATVTLVEVKNPYRIFYDEPVARRHSWDPYEFSVKMRSANPMRPAGPLDIDWTNPLTKGLRIVYFPQDGTDPYQLMHDSGPYKLGRATPTNQEPYQGRLWSRSDATAGYLEWDVDANHWINGAETLTMMFGGQRGYDNAVTVGGGWCFHDSGNNSSRAGMYVLSTDHINFQADNADNANAQITNAATAVDTYYGIFTYDGRQAVGDRAYGHAKGRWVSLGSASKATNLLTTYDKLYFNAAPYSAVIRGTTDVMDYGYVWDRKLTWEEVQQLEENPYSFFKQRLDIPTFMPKDTNINVNATTQSLALSTYNVVTPVRSAATQALTITTYPATIAAGPNIKATTQALTITTYPATVNAETNVQATTQALTITTHNIAWEVRAKSQALSITTYPATIPVNKTVDATTQALTITTHRAGILPRNVVCTTQALTITGLKTQAMHSSAHTAALTVTGHPVNVYHRTEEELLGRQVVVLAERREIDVE